MKQITFAADRDTMSQGRNVVLIASLDRNDVQIRGCVCVYPGSVIVFSSEGHFLIGSDRSLVFLFFPLPSNFSIHPGLPSVVCNMYNPHT